MIKLWTELKTSWNSIFPWKNDKHIYAFVRYFLKNKQVTKATDSIYYQREKLSFQEKIRILENFYLPLWNMSIIELKKSMNLYLPNDQHIVINSYIANIYSDYKIDQWILVQ